MSNDVMYADRFGRWARARKVVSAITDHLKNGGVVMVATYGRATQYGKKHAGMFRATKTGAYVQHGKNWDCIDYCSIKFYTYKPA